MPDGCESGPMTGSSRADNHPPGPFWAGLGQPLLDDAEVVADPHASRHLFTHE